jgi:Domain of unknown function (DUF5615)
VRLLLDEMLAPAIARGLRAWGHDVTAVAGDPAHEGLSDREVLAFACAEGRAVVTNNLKDFRPLHAEALLSGTGHFGLIFMPETYRRTHADIGRTVDALEAKLKQFPSDRGLADSETWL